MPPVLQKYNHNMIDMLKELPEKTHELQNHEINMLTIPFYCSIVHVNPCLWDRELLFTGGECKLIKVILHRVDI